MWGVPILMYAIAAVNIYSVFKNGETAERLPVIVLWIAALAVITLYSFFPQTPELLDMFFESKLT